MIHKPNRGTSNEPIVLTREELYRQVWSEPIIHVASGVGLSGRGLGKLCARHNIPVPPRGWWAKKRHGHRVRQTPLLQIEDPRLERIVFHMSESQPAEADAPELLRENNAEWRIDVLGTCRSRTLWSNVPRPPFAPPLVNGTIVLVVDLPPNQLGPGWRGHRTGSRVWVSGDGGEPLRCFYAFM